jgi:hypothetical protein
MSQEAVGDSKSVSAVPQPIVDEVCERTCDLLRQSDVFTEECADAVCRLINADRDKMKPAQVIEALSGPTKEAHEDP